MLITRDVAAFLTSPVMTIIGTRDKNYQPEIARGVGTIANIRTGVVEIVFSSWQWPGTFANLTDNGYIAVTYSRPSDYVSYQIKGRAALRAATPDDLAVSARYRAGILTVLDAFNLAPIAGAWLTERDAHVATVMVSETFVQTPGPKAGKRLDSVS